ncbi:MAG: MATE family efflux transporter [Dysgonamonadaceae bacterium]|jgi:putative MATE family efflux protein|nr:MATE family efflux transporter [Dysgonamonadaceae bacterium]MDD3727757.1 MATE family efflux transporter [Dysgonamonadaceae bacterium]MDD4246381.1 MATE family efflux transporter [Dysgonamonadaceae bacterium]MDD4605493.1 MATE family efflux transporter [Dysgonamonadaceae bacterium]HUI32085.1 MATE family efflux transporter [Dysgonamonadaceae bacterium]
MYKNNHILKISYPIFLSLLAQNIIQVIDTAFLGRVGEIELGASALAGIFYIGVYTLGFGYSMGSQILIGRRNGEQNYHEISDIVVQGLIVLIPAAILLIPAMNFVSNSWLPSLFESEEITVAVNKYLDWRFYGLIFAFTNSMFRAFYIGIAGTKILTLNAVVMALTNVLFDYLLIFGKFGFPEMGIAGAALASVISEFVSTLFFLIYTLRKVDLDKYGFKKIKIHMQVVKQVLSISVFMMIQYLLSIFVWMLFFVFIEHLGERPLAISNIVRSFYTILILPAQALSTSTNTMVSNTIGAGRHSEVLDLLKRVIKISLSITAVIMVVVFLFPKVLIQIYTNDPVLIAETVPPMYVLITLLPIFSVGAIFFNAVSGTGNTKTALIFELFTLTFYLSYMWWIIVYLESSVALCWTSEHIYWFFLMTFSFLYLKFGKWQNKKL